MKKTDAEKQLRRCAAKPSMTTVRDILTAVDRLAPFRLAGAWDNVGLLFGAPGRKVRR